MLSPSLSASLLEATERYSRSVAAAAFYLEGRGVTEQVALSFRLGVVSDPIPGHERFAGMLAIPYLTPRGVVAMKFRRFDGTEGAKYDSPLGQKLRLFNAQSLASGGDVALICEGEFDTIAATSALGVPAVGTPGTNWFDHWPRCFGDFDRVVIVADNDKKEDESNPGVKHAQKIAKSISGAEVVLPPMGLDLSEWIQGHGVEAVRGALDI